jgi:tetratricopeptide (TPR) repeat protein
VLGQGQVIRAWDLGFASARKGEKFTLTAAPAYAYGANGSPPKIPANATLKFECELIGFGPKKKQSWEMSSNEKVAEAERCKGEGNRCFTSGDLRGALDEYKAGWRAIEYLTEDSAGAELLDASSSALLSALRVTLHSNSAMVHLKLSDFGEAVKDCNAALRWDPANAKALFRRGTARAGLGLLEDAKADLLAAAKASPSDAGIRAELDRVKKLAAEAAQREKKAFGGIFAGKGKGFSLGGGSEEAQPAKAAAAAPAATTEGEEESA